MSVLRRRIPVFAKHQCATLRDFWSMVYRLRWLVSYFQVPGESPSFFIRTIGGSVVKELSIFVDESGDRGGKARYYLLTLVFHDQAESITEAVTGYEARLAKEGRWQSAAL